MFKRRVKSNSDNICFILAGILLLAVSATYGADSSKAAKSNAAPRETKMDAAEWNNVLEAAKKEGKLVVTSSIAENLREALKTSMKKYGIEMEFIIGRPPEITAKVLGEQRAGLYLEDVHIGGAGSPTVTLKPAGALVPLEPILVLPEVLDPKAWWGGRLLWVDKEHYQIAFLSYPQVPLIINTGLVKPGEIKSYRDLLDPKWKGNMVLMDPALGGMGADSFVTVTHLLGLDYLRELAKQDPVIIQDSRLQIEWVARGSKAIGIWVRPEMIKYFLDAGAPIHPITPTEGICLSPATGGIALYKRAPHPNAAKLFINWLLTKEGGTVFSKAFGGQSAREDVPTDFLHPLFIRQSGVKYYDGSRHEHAVEMVAAGPLSKEIFGTSR